MWAGNHIFVPVMMFKKKQYIPSGSLGRMAWHRLMKNRIAVVSMVFILLLILISVLGYLITPDHTPYANEQFVELSARKPGFSIQMLKVMKNRGHQSCSFFRRMVYGCSDKYQQVPVYHYEFSGSNIVIEEYTGMQPNEGEIKTYSLADVLYALPEGAMIDSLNGTEVQFEDIEGKVIRRSVAEMQQQLLKNHLVNRRFLLGTDRYGRDVLSQLMIGTRVSLSVGFISVAISLLIGILLGSLAGYFRGWVDNLIMWFINVVWAIPTLLLVIAITFVLGKGFWQVFVAVGLTMWVEVARVVRGQILSVREKDYVEAARALGYKHSRIIFRHILPNVMAPVIVISAANFASAILMEAGLSFLGIGVQPPMPSWGTMIKEHYAYIILDKAYLAIIPGLAIMFTVLAFMLTGNALRDALDVKSE